MTKKWSTKLIKDEIYASDPAEKNQNQKFMVCRCIRVRHTCTIKIEVTWPIFHGLLTSNQFVKRLDIWYYNITYNHNFVWSCYLGESVSFLPKLGPLTYISSSNDSGSLSHPSIVLRYCASYHHLATSEDESLGVCQRPTKIRSLWPTFNALLTRVTFTFEFSSQVLFVLPSFSLVCVCVFGSMHPAKIRSLWPTFHALWTRIHFYIRV